MVCVRGGSWPEGLETVTVIVNDETTGPFGVRVEGRPLVREAIQGMLDAGLLDELMSRIDNGELQLTGEGGFIPEMIKSVLERGLNAELTSHVGYAKGDPEPPEVSCRSYAGSFF